ncbi:MAG: hypothetical protein LUG27_11525, partial [Clostridiales bacterium]|nr:hypothetical protein [Clostridiales bacterium]
GIHDHRTDDCHRRRLDHVVIQTLRFAIHGIMELGNIPVDNREDSIRGSLNHGGGEPRSVHGKTEIYIRRSYGAVMYKVNENISKIFSGLCTLSGRDLVL